MNKLLNAFLHMKGLDDFAMDQTWVHRLHPLLKLVSCFLMIIFILTSYSVIELTLYIFLLFILSYLSHINFIKVIKRSLIGLPFSLCIGISYLIFNHHFVSFYGFVVYDGVILCLLVFIKTFLCLGLTYILISTTPFDEIASELVHIKVPAIFVLQLTMTYRYIFVFLNEAQKMSQAYILRNPQSKAIEFKDMGSFVGHLLVKSMNESRHIYDCMKCRGFNIQKTYTHYKILTSDSVFMMMIIIGILILIKAVCI